MLSLGQPSEQASPERVSKKLSPPSDGLLKRRSSLKLTGDLVSVGRLGRNGRVVPRCFLVSELEDEDKLQNAEDLENEPPFEKSQVSNGKFLDSSAGKKLWSGDREDEQ